jgi:RNA polymerase sigma-70 factor (ECF subfamily)
MPDGPEAAGLLSLMVFQHSGRAARTDERGDLVTLEEQDRSRWDRAAIEEANAILDRAVGRGDVGPYQLQALIAACHANSSGPTVTDWARIARLYARLLELTSNPFVELNRAVAVGMAATPEAGLALVDGLIAAGELHDYHLLHATRADLLRRLGRNSEAGESYGRALEHARTDAERRYLSARLTEVGAAEPANRDRE